MKKELFTIEPNKGGSSSKAASFCTVLGILTWIGGLIIAISAGNAGTYYDNSFSFTIFLSSLIPYGIAGGMMLCLAELFSNLQSIADSLKSMRVMGDKEELLFVNNAATTEASKAQIDPQNSNPTTKYQMPVTEAQAPGEGAPIILDGDFMKCPSCGQVQKKDRSICYSCGFKFKNQD